MKKLLLSVLFIIAGFSYFEEVKLLAAPAQNIIDFEIEVELINNTKYDIEYDIKGQNRIEAKYAVPGSVTLHGKNAVEIIEPLFQELNLTPRMDLETLKTNVLAIFKINQADVEDFEIEVKFTTGEKIKIDD